MDRDEKKSTISRRKFLNNPVKTFITTAIAANLPMMISANF
jgi:hypothetical protein